MTTDAPVQPPSAADPVGTDTDAAATTEPDAVAAGQWERASVLHLKTLAIVPPTAQSD